MVGDLSYELQLPVLGLTGLRHLDPKGMRLKTARGADLPDVAVLPQEWSCLTHLALNKCFMQLDALPQFTDLQSLKLSMDNHAAYLPGTGSHDEQLSLVAAALPNLTRLQLGEQQTRL